MENFDWETIKLPKQLRYPERRYVYVLGLKNGKYYVGTTLSPRVRFLAHHKGETSPFVIEHRPIEAYQLVALSTMDIKNGLKEENLETLRMIKKHGFENVYGGAITGKPVRRLKIYHTLLKKYEGLF